MAETSDANPTATLELLKKTVTEKVLNESLFVGGKILSADVGPDKFGKKIDILNPLGLTPTQLAGVGVDLTTVGGGASLGASDEISMGGVLASLALSLGPTLLFLSRTPAVVKLMDDLNNPNEEEEGDREGDEKKSKNAKDKFVDEPEEMPTILARF